MVRNHAKDAKTSYDAQIVMNRFVRLAGKVIRAMNAQKSFALNASTNVEETLVTTVTKHCVSHAIFMVRIFLSSLAMAHATVKISTMSMIVTCSKIPVATSAQSSASCSAVAFCARV